MIKYFCDCCEEEQKEEYDLHDISLDKKARVCIKCYWELHTAFYEKVAEIRKRVNQNV